MVPGYVLYCRIVSSALSTHFFRQFSEECGRGRSQSTTQFDSLKYLKHSTNSKVNKPIEFECKQIVTRTAKSENSPGKPATKKCFADSYRSVVVSATTGSFSLFNYWLVYLATQDSRASCCNLLLLILVV